MVVRMPPLQIDLKIGSMLLPLPIDDRPGFMKELSDGWSISLRWRNPQQDLEEHYGWLHGTLVENGGSTEWKQAKSFPKILCGVCSCAGV